LNQETSDLFENLFQLSQLFLQQIGMGPNHGGREQVATVVKKAVDFRPGLGYNAELQSALAFLSEEQRSKILSIVGKEKLNLINQLQNLSEENQQLKSTLNASNMTTVNETNAASSVNVPSRATNEPPAADEQVAEHGRKRGGAQNLDEARAFIKKAKDLQILDYMKSLASLYPDKSQLTESERNYMHTAVFPILRCLEKHHDNNTEQFLKKWPLEGGVKRFAKTQFNCKGPLCGVVKPN
jgi:hypothetical protein